MTLQEFVAARIGTRHYDVNSAGRLTIDAKRRGASKAISFKFHARLEGAWKRGEAPGDRLTGADLRLLRALEGATSCQILRMDDGTFWHPQAGTIERRRLARWQARGIIEPLQPSLLPAVPSSYTVTPKGLHIGKGAPRA